MTQHLPIGDAIASPPASSRVVARVRPDNDIEASESVLERACRMHIPRDVSGNAAAVIYAKPIEFRKWIRLKVEGLDAPTALLLQLVAAATGEPQEVDGYPLPIVTFGFAATTLDAITESWSIDLDGGTNPVPIVRRLRRAVGDAGVLVTSGSGRAGRFRAGGYCAPITIRRLRIILRALLRDYGELVGKPGHIELYPSCSNSRIPAGIGGLTVYTDSDLTKSVTLPSPWALLAMLDAMPVVDWELVARELGLRVPAEYAPAHTAKGSKGGRSGRSPSQPAVPTRGPTREAAHYWTNGAGPGERDDAIGALLYDCFRRRLSLEATIAAVTEWIRRGGISRTEGGRTESSRAQEIKALRKRAEKVYTYALPRRPLPRNFTARELRDLADMVEAMIPEAEQARVFAFHLEMLVRFKGGLSGTFETMRVHRDEWRDVGGYSYRALRDALGLFVPTITAGMQYRTKAEYKSEAHATFWKCLFPFDMTTPRRPVVAVHPAGRRTSGTVQTSPKRTAGALWKAARIVADRERGIARSNRSGSLPNQHDPFTHRTWQGRAPAAAGSPAVSSIAITRAADSSALPAGGRLGSPSPREPDATQDQKVGAAGRGADRFPLETLLFAIVGRVDGGIASRPSRKIPKSLLRRPRHLGARPALRARDPPIGSAIPRPSRRSQLPRGLPHDEDKDDRQASLHAARPGHLMTTALVVESRRGLGPRLTMISASETTESLADFNRRQRLRRLGLELFQLLRQASLEKRPVVVTLITGECVAGLVSVLGPSGVRLTEPSARREQAAYQASVDALAYAPAAQEVARRALELVVRRERARERKILGEEVRAAVMQSGPLSTSVVTAAPVLPSVVPCRPPRPYVAHSVGSWKRRGW